MSEPWVRCRLPLRKTWAELGEISSRGTTDAGRKAELAINNSIVDLAEKLISEPPKERFDRVIVD